MWVGSGNTLAGCGVQILSHAGLFGVARAEMRALNAPGECHFLEETGISVAGVSLVKNVVCTPRPPGRGPNA